VVEHVVVCPVSYIVNGVCGVVVGRAYHLVR
jgi:predicted membrane protein